MFSGSGNPREVLGILFHQTGSGQSKMAAIKLEVLISQLVDKRTPDFTFLQNPVTSKC